MLPVIELSGQAEGDLAGELGVATHLGRLDGIPQVLAVPRQGRCVRRGEDLGVDRRRVGGGHAVQAVVVAVLERFGLPGRRRLQPRSVRRRGR